MLAKVCSSSLLGIDAILVKVKIDSSQCLPRFFTVENMGKLWVSRPGFSMVSRQFNRLILAALFDRFFILLYVQVKQYIECRLNFDLDPLVVSPHWQNLTIGSGFFMNSFALFTDVSLNPQRKIGIGGYLLVPTQFLETQAHDIKRGEISARLRFRRFTETSSTKLEVQTVLWALNNFREEFNRSDQGSVLVYTDSQCVAGLLARRAGLEANDFLAGRSGRPLTNATLYRAFYAAYDEIGFELIKVAGHSRASSHDTVQRIFSYVDREVRRALTLWIGESGEENE
jgi:ribonuclease HI